MSRTLRRPMFRGGKIDSRGTGITSGLDKPKRGLVDEPGGYAGEEFLVGEGTFSEFQRGKPGFSSPSNPSLATRGMNILKSARNKVFGIPYLGATLKTLSTPLSYAGAMAMAPATLKTAALTAPFAAVGGLAYMFHEKGGRIQEIVLSKTNTKYVRSATLVDLIYSLILWYFKSYNDYLLAAKAFFIINPDCNLCPDVPLDIKQGLKSEICYDELLEHVNNCHSHPCKKCDLILKLDICKNLNHILYPYGHFNNDCLGRNFKFPVKIF